MSKVLAVDIGTTTIALSVTDTDRVYSACEYDLPASSSAAFFKADSNELTAVIENPQRLYGSDVISRMNNAIKPQLAKKMRSLIRDAIKAAVADRFHTGWQSLSGIVISGNTMMTHLFYGLDVSGMLTVPFTPADLSPEICDWDGVPVTSMPGISAFVGGDIVSGIYALKLIGESSPVLLADLGTNGELVLAVGGKILSTSVAAGPAFEGGNLSIGMPALPGAIDSLTVKNGFCRIHTIERQLPPKGLCGSGLIEAVFELKQDGILDTHGSFLSGQYRENGFPLYIQNIDQKLALSQEDVRAFQVAKAAVRAGIDALLSEARLSLADISRFYLAGSFGQHIDIKKASGIGLIPEDLVNCTFLVGNTSLAGAVRLAQHPDDYPAVAKIAAAASSVSLADSDIFKESYFRNMDL